MTSPFQDLCSQTLFDAVPEAMLLIDKSGYVVLTNSAARQLLGYSEKEIIGLEVEALMPRQYHEHHRHYRNAFNENPEQRNMGTGAVLDVLCQDGKVLKVDIGLTPVRMTDQKFTLASIRVADRRRQAEEALRTSEERLRLSKQAANLAVFDFGPNYIIKHWDEKMSVLWGAEAESELSDKQFLTVIHPDDRHAREYALNSATDPAGKGKYKIEYRVIEPATGAERWVIALGRVFFKNGVASRLIGVARDITERKLLSKKLQQYRNETESLLAQQVAAQTASAIAHELNQPLAAISAYGEVALHAFENDSIDETTIKHALESCIEQAHRAGKSLHELIAFLQKGDLIKEQFNLNDLVKEAVNIARGDDYGHFTPELQIEENLATVIGNKIQIQKILVNLLRNAIEAVRTINTASPPITITVRNNSEIKMVHVTVKDKGPGLNADIAQRVFEPFFTTKPTGVGMGLAISRALTEANGGKMWLDPSDGTGAAFHFTLPLAS
ncbi:MAG: PAS domain S-box protein [Betaproteobacteria bacterium]|nr:PAS domain S-box protein [Betaproteobacteria bacterium]